MRHDPTIDEMRAFLLAAEPDADEFDREEAIYWFASDYHGGQWSNLYAALCASPFKPSPVANGPSETAFGCYAQLASNVPMNN